jgi:hypothetical protein
LTIIKRRAKTIFSADSLFIFTISYVVLFEKYLKINTRKIFLAGLPFYETLGKERPSTVTAEQIGSPLNQTRWAKYLSHESGSC